MRSHFSARASSHRAASVNDSAFSENRVSRPARSDRTNPARSSSWRCRATACRLIGRRAENPVAVPLSSEASHSTRRRRVGSESAAKTSGLSGNGSNPRQVPAKVLELGVPSGRVLVDLGLICVVGKIGEPGFEQRQSRAIPFRDQRELNERRGDF